LRSVVTVFVSAFRAARHGFINGKGSEQMEITVDTSELKALVGRLEKAGKATPQNTVKVLKTIGLIVGNKAVSYAPRSQKKAEYVATLKGKKTKRATDSFHPGQLKGSITAEVFPERVEIGVPSNSPAQAYAEKIHNSYKRTPHNDAKATEKYIFKARDDSEREYMAAVESLVDKLIAAI